MKLSKPTQPTHSAAYSNSNVHNPTVPVMEQKKKFEIAGTEFIVDAKYDIIKQIGSGAYGVVVSARDLTT